MTRTAALAIFSLVFFLRPAFAAGQTAVQSMPVEEPVPLERMGEETFLFDIGFLWFDQVAEVRLSFTAEARPGLYRAVLEARTKGIAAWLTGHRVQRYESLMEFGREGRLHSLRHERHIIKGPEKKRIDLSKKYRFDHSGKQVVFEGFRNGESLGGKTLQFEGPTLPEDILTIFYNLRAGFYGPVGLGDRYRIPTLSEEGESFVVVSFVSPEERRDNPFIGTPGLLGKVKVIQNVFETGGGPIYVWFDRISRPRWGLVENVVGYGDVRGVARTE